MDSRMTKAIEELAEVFGDSWTAADVGGHLNCTEADTIARVLILAGHSEDAEAWLSGHADGDECGDEHHFGPEHNEGCECGAEELMTASQYVQRLSAEA